MRWKFKPCDLAVAAELARAQDLPPAVARLLVQRNICDADAVRRFLDPSIEHLHSPYLMRGMRAAVERIEGAIAQKENILIYGDYDVDGTTAVVILKTCIERLSGRCEFHVPHRIRDGYGMKDDVIERAAASGIKLVISVDTGIRAFDAAATARRVGLDLIVTDHHLPEANEGVPHALAVLNPNQAGCDYPCKELCGAGVAMKLAQALLTSAGQERLIPSFLKMVAIATVADAVPLTGENRVMTRLGLEGLRRPVNGGLKALMQVAQLENVGRALTGSDVAFRLAPRINAAGRMDVAAEVIELFTCTDEARQRELANKLDMLNTERQSEESRILVEVHSLLDSDIRLREAYSVVLAGERWHRGVIGIVATRVVERTCKPALVISCDPDSGLAHGSGRSIHGFHLLDALESAECRKLFTKFGGHAHAVGFSLPNDKVDCLREALEAFARTKLTPADLLPLLELDGGVELSEVTPELLHSLRALEPFGVGNREPVFAAHAVRVLQSPKVLKEKHVKLRVAESTADGKVKRPFDALGWRMAEPVIAMNLLPGDAIDLAFTIEENTNPDFGGLQMVLKDVLPAQRANHGAAVAVQT